MSTPTTATWPKPASEDEFEEICLDFLRLRWKDPSSARNGRRDKRQDGVDIVGRPERFNGATAGARCKNADALTLDSVVAVARKAEGFRGGLAELLVITSGEYDATLQAEIRRYFKATPASFSVDIVFWDDVIAGVAVDYSLVAKHWRALSSRDRVGLDRVNATIVAFYGDKPARLTDFIVRLHELLGSKLGAAFIPYTLPQVHATLVGLEGDVSTETGEVFNRNYAELRGEPRLMNVARALRRIESAPAFPLAIRIGGFEPGIDYSFVSRGQHPCRRCFSIQGKDTVAIAVAMGWPWTDGAESKALACLRKVLESEGVLHKYHSTPEARDNDFFFVLGRIERSRLDEATLDAIVDEVRELMARSAFELLVDLNDVKMVFYVDPSLPLDSSRPTRLPCPD